MIEIEIPGYDTLRIEHVVMDVNGTLAVDGGLLFGVPPRLERLSSSVSLHMLTADTHGKQAVINEQLGFEAHIITQGAAEKAEYVQRLGGSTVAAIGNGANDVEMFRVAALGIAVLGIEGLSTALVQEADILVADITNALDLFLSPNRLRATLRR